MLLLCLVSACNKPTRISYDAAEIKDYLGIAVPSSASNVRAQIIQDENEHIVWFMLKFKIPKNDLEYFAQKLKMVKIDKGEASVAPLPLIDVGKPQSAWWNPPDLIDQWKLPDRYQGNCSYNRGKDNDMSMIWFDGWAYLEVYPN